MYSENYISFDSYDQSFGYENNELNIMDLDIPQEQEIFQEPNQESSHESNDSKQMKIEKEITNEEQNINYGKIYKIQNDNLPDIELNKDKTTNPTSKENAEKKPILNPFITLKPLKRIDYLKKFYKKYFSSFSKNYANDLIQESELPENFKKKQLSMPNSKSFTGNVKEKDNYTFLDFSIKEMFCYYKNEKCKISRQINNKKLINGIMDYIGGLENPENFEELINFFNMSVEEGYKLFEESESFRAFCRDPKIIFLDKEFRAQKGFSLRSKNGFVYLTKMYRKKLKQ